MSETRRSVIIFVTVMLLFSMFYVWLDSYGQKNEQSFIKHANYTEGDVGVFIFPAPYKVVFIKNDPTSNIVSGDYKLPAAKVDYQTFLKLSKGGTVYAWKDSDNGIVMFTVKNNTMFMVTGYGLVQNYYHGLYEHWISIENAEIKNGHLYVYAKLDTAGVNFLLIVAVIASLLFVAITMLASY